jgi:hypothetical protein
MDSYLVDLNHVCTTDSLGRSVDPACGEKAHKLAQTLLQYGVDLPSPLNSGDEERAPCIYLQWTNASVYIFKDRMFYISAPECNEELYDGLEQVENVCKRAKEDRVKGE